MSTIELLTLALGLMLGANTMAQSNSENNYRAGREKIELEARAAQSNCRRLSASAKETCVVKAQGKAKVARADLEAAYRPTARTHYLARVAKAETIYAVAKERCDTYSANSRRSCLNQAKLQFDKT
jgi:uncharacterized membrane protein